MRLRPGKITLRGRHRALARIAALTLAVALPAAALPACSHTTSSGTAPDGVTPANAGNDGAGTAAIVPRPASPALNWQACTGQLAGLECARLRVPLDYADPAGRKITIALSMAPATAPRTRQQGVLLVNPGGPGEPGRPFVTQVAAGLSPQVAATYDIVGFDTRDSGGSTPALTCDPGFYQGVRPDYIPASARDEQVLIDRAKGYAQGCEQRSGWFLPHITTVNMARDLDEIRKAFGVQQVNYYAFSYGTYLGQVYGTLFPAHVRRMVLDSTVDPAGAWYRDNISQDYAFQRRIGSFFAWTARYHATYHLGTTQAQVAAAYYRARGRLAKQPAAGTVGPDELDDTFLMAGYLQGVWPVFARVLAQYLNQGNSGGLVAQYRAWGVQPANSFAIYNAVECNDVNWPRTWARWQSDAQKVYQTAPFQAWDNAWFNAACAFWPVKSPPTPFPVHGSKLPPVLMLQGTLDAATPYAGAQVAHKLLPTARMVVVEGGGNHGQSLEDPANACVDHYLNSYLAGGVLPEKPGQVNATCAPVADPAPGP
jgi:pimeloyl-ACP methyl ester carboxylesterase